MNAFEIAAVVARSVSAARHVIAVVASLSRARFCW
jgi:hypothetical protein